MGGDGAMREEEAILTTTTGSFNNRTLLASQDTNRQRDRRLSLHEQCLAQAKTI